MKHLTIATRGSKLALWQAEHIRALLEKEHNLEVRLLVLKTRGDIILDVPLAKVGGKGLFVKEIEEALLDGRADIAVHSMKDVPMELPEGLILGAVPERADPADLLLSVNWPDLASLPLGAHVGTSSLRRQAQLLALRPDLAVTSLRGNVDTRIRKLLEGEFDAIVMASAGMRRLELSTPHMFALRAPEFLPAAGQGALGIELKADRPELLDKLRFLNHPASFALVAAERAFLQGLDGGCQVPIAAYATLEPAPVQGTIAPGSILTLEGLVADPHGKRFVRDVKQGDPAEAQAIGLALAQAVKKAGGAAILQEVYEVGAS